MHVSAISDWVPKGAVIEDITFDVMMSPANLQHAANNRMRSRGRGAGTAASLQGIALPEGSGINIHMVDESVYDMDANASLLMNKQALADRLSDMPVFSNNNEAGMYIYIYMCVCMYIFLHFSQRRH